MIGPLPEAASVAYDYDGAYQLTKETRTGGLAYTQSFSYDVDGHRTKAVLGGTTTNYQYNQMGQLTKYGTNAVTWDCYGNITGIWNDHYYWDHSDRLTKFDRYEGTANDCVVRVHPGELGEVQEGAGRGDGVLRVRWPERRRFLRVGRRLERPVPDARAWTPTSRRRVAGARITTWPTDWGACATSWTPRRRSRTRTITMPLGTRSWRAPQTSRTPTATPPASTSPAGPRHLLLPQPLLRLPTRHLHVQGRPVGGSAEGVGVCAKRADCSGWTNTGSLGLNGEVSRAMMVT